MAEATPTPPAAHDPAPMMTPQEIVHELDDTSGPSGSV